MVTKDRFEEFKVRSQVAQVSLDKSGAFPSEVEEAMSQSEPLLYTEEEWSCVEELMAAVDRLRRDLHLLGSYVEDVKIKHSQLLMSPHSDQKLKEELDQAMEAFRQLSESARAQHKGMELETEAMIAERQNRGRYDPHAMDLRVRKTQQMGLSKHLHEVLRAYGEEQARYRDRCMNRIEGYLQLTGKTIDHDEVDTAIESGQLYDFAGGLLLQQRNYAQILEDLESRRDDILRLESSIRELHQMFQDIALLVESQGEIVNRIENHVFMAVDYSQRAGRHMTRAHTYQNKYRKKKVCLCITIPVVILIILAICAALFCSQFGCSSSSS